MMTMSIEKTINDKLATIFNKLELDTKFAIVKTSDRPDLSDLQCNGALALAKCLKDRKSTRLNSSHAT